MNLNIVFWGKADLHNFLKEVKEDQKMRLIISYLDIDSDPKFQIHPLITALPPLVIHGYIYSERRPDQ